MCRPVRQLPILLLLVGCGVGKPVIAPKRADVKELLTTVKTPLQFSAAVAPVSLPKKASVSHRFAALPQIPPQRLQTLLVDVSKKMSLFKKAFAVKGGSKPPLEAASNAKADLLLVPKFSNAEVYYAGTTKWFLPNIFIWFFVDAASWFVADEKYGIYLKGNVSLYSVHTGKHLFTLPIECRVEAALDDFQRGWKFWGIFFVPKKLNDSNWAKVTRTLLPHLEEEIKAQFIKRVLSSFLSFTKTPQFASLYKPTKKTTPSTPSKPTEKPKPLTLLTKTLPPAEEGKKYSVKLQASGGTPPYKWAVKGLPKGLVARPSGLIEGVPAEGIGGKMYSVTVELRDSGNRKVSAKLSLMVKARRMAPPVAKPAPVVHALVVGVEDYKGGNVGRAAFALRDARAVADAIRSLHTHKNSSVTLIEGAKATLSSLKKALAAVKPCDIFIFFFAGNGATSFAEGAPHCLLLYDTAFPDMKNALSLDDLLKLCRKVKAKQRIVLIDAGFNMSGEGRTPAVTEAKPKIHALPTLKEKDIVAIVACDGTQTAYSSGLSRVRHGFFTYFLLKALAGKADKNNDSELTEDEIFKFVESRVKEEAPNMQTPVKLGEGKATLLLKSSK